MPCPEPLPFWPHPPLQSRWEESAPEPAPRLPNGVGSNIWCLPASGLPSPKLRMAIVVGALVVLNPVGDVFTLEGESLTGGDPVPGPPGIRPQPVTNTVLVVIVTDAAMSRAELTRLAIRSHDAVGACVRPAHTRFDGDVVFVSAVGTERGDVDLAAEAAFVATGRAIEAGVRAS